MLEEPLELTGSLKVPRNLGEITPLWLTEALSFLRERPGLSVTGYSAEAIVEGKGFMNRLFKLDLEYSAVSADLPRSAVVKLPSADPVLRTIFDRLGQNRREVMFYSGGVGWLSARHSGKLPPWVGPALRGHHPAAGGPE